MPGCVLIVWGAVGVVPDTAANNTTASARTTTVTTCAATAACAQPRPQLQGASTRRRTLVPPPRRRARDAVRAADGHRTERVAAPLQDREVELDVVVDALDLVDGVLIPVAGLEGAHVTHPGSVAGTRTILVPDAEMIGMSNTGLVSWLRPAWTFDENVPRPSKSTSP